MQQIIEQFETFKKFVPTSIRAVTDHAHVWYKVYKIENYGNKLTNKNF